MLALTKINATAYKIVFSKEELILNSDGTLYWPKKKLLVFSDLHLGKGSYFALTRRPIPIYDTQDTLLSMQTSIQAYTPENVLCLGDSFHDRNAFERLHKQEKNLLKLLIQQTNSWYWIAGNHDSKGIVCQTEREKILLNLAFPSFTFSHKDISPFHPHIIGHYHPKLKISVKKQIIKGKCFVISPDLIVMPAFGSYTGGLKVNSCTIKKLISSDPVIYFLLNKQKIWPLSSNELAEL